MPTDCICDLLDKPTYHVSDNPHSVEKKWDCLLHGHQERYWLIHQQPEPYCTPCNKESSSWQVAKGNLLRLYHQYPNLVGDLLDSAYLHGLEAKQK